MLNLSRDTILYYADMHDQELIATDALQFEADMKQKLSKQDYLSKDDFLKIGRWKSPRPIKHYESNNEELVREVSSISFNTKNEELKVGVLTLLKGCSFPVASAILHFRYPDTYPIIDFRALWSLQGITGPIKYSYDYWKKYVDDIQSTSKKFEVDIRTLDKALWMYSKKMQQD